MSASEILKKLPAALKSEAVAGKHVTVQLNMSTPAWFTIADGVCTAHEGVANAADVTLTASEENLLKILAGQLSGLTAMFTGRLKVTGDLMLAKDLDGFFDPAKLV